MGTLLPLTALTGLMVSMLNRNILYFMALEWTNGHCTTWDWSAQAPPPRLRGGFKTQREAINRKELNVDS